MNKIEKKLSLLLLLTGLFAYNQTLFTPVEDVSHDQANEQAKQAKIKKAHDLEEIRIHDQGFIESLKKGEGLKHLIIKVKHLIKGRPEVESKTKSGVHLDESKNYDHLKKASEELIAKKKADEQLKAAEEFKATEEAKAKVTKEFNNAYKQFTSDGQFVKNKIFTDAQISELKTLSLQILGLDPKNDFSEQALRDAASNGTEEKSNAFNFLEEVRKIEAGQKLINSVTSLADLTKNQNPGGGLKRVPIMSLSPITFNRLTDEQIQQLTSSPNFDAQADYFLKMLADRDAAIKSANRQKLADESNAQKEAAQKDKAVVKKEAARRQNLADTQEDEAMNRINQREKTNAEKFEVAKKMNEKYKKAFGIKGMRNIDLIPLTEEEISELKTLSCQLLGLDPKNYTDKEIDDALNKTNKSTIFSGNEDILAQTKKAYFFLKEEAQQAKFLKTDQAIIDNAKPFSKLTAEQVKALHQITISRLTDAQIEQLSDLQIANLRIEQINAFSDIQLKAFSDNQIKDLIKRFDSFRSPSEEIKQSFNKKLDKARQLSLTDQKRINARQ
ncbi:MAG: hypothetical protein NTZ68_03925 [Candidatus Dependentiae bacterium]|nr:hypothetical protein [Candidatus Dependentiae bacterium]